MYIFAAKPQKYKYPNKSFPAQAQGQPQAGGQQGQQRRAAQREFDRLDRYSCAGGSGAG